MVYLMVGIELSFLFITKDIEKIMIVLDEANAIKIHDVIIELNGKKKRQRFSYKEKKRKRWNVATFIIFKVFLFHHNKE